MDGKQAAALLSDKLTSIYGYAFARLYDKEEVDDLTSEIVLEIMKSASHLKEETSFWAFAWKIAENTFRKFIKRKERKLKMEPLPAARDFIDLGKTPEEKVIEDETQKESIFLLRRELSLLSKTHREVCVAYYLHNRSCSEIANEQMISLDMVKYHLFKTRKLLREGIGMTRELGEKSYNPGTFRLIFWGDRNVYSELFRRKLPGSIVLAAYDVPMTAQALSVELGVSLPYLEEELETLVVSGVIKKTGESYRTNLVILTEAYEKDMAGKTANLYQSAAGQLYQDALYLLPKVKELSFDGNNFDDNRLLWMLLNSAMIQGYFETCKKSPIGNAKKLPLGGTGFLFGHDNNGIYKHINDVCIEAWNKEKSAWFSAINYCVIEKSQFFQQQNFELKREAMCAALLGREEKLGNDTVSELIDDGFISCINGYLKANFPVFPSAVFQSFLNISGGLGSQVSDLMIKVSDIAEAVLKEYVPVSVKDQCGNIAKIHHRLDVAACLFDYMVAEGMLTVPETKTPICVFGVRA